jgi:hypothetical protein
MRGISITRLRSDQEVQDSIKEDMTGYVREGKPIPSHEELLKEALHINVGWYKRFGEFGKARVFSDVKETRRALKLARRGDSKATFSEYEVVEFEVKQINQVSIDQFYLDTIPTPKKRTKKVLVKAIP